MIRVGSVVRLKRGLRGARNHKKTARVELIYKDIRGGVRLDRELEGFRSWNVQDLEPASTPSANRSTAGTR